MAIAYKYPPQPRSPRRSVRRSMTAPIPIAQRRSRRSQNSKRAPLPLVGRNQSRRMASPMMASRSAPVVRPIQPPKKLPSWLRMLVLAQRSSLVITFILVVTTLFVYGSTVYMQQLWSKEYRKMKTLQRSERQMVAASEVMKGQIVEQADHSGSGMVKRTQEMAVFLQPAPPRPPQPLDPSLSQPLTPAASSAPLSY